MNDFTDLMEAVINLGFNAELELDHYFDFESQIFYDGFELRRADFRLQFIRLQNNELLLSRGAVFTGEAISGNDREEILRRHNLWTLYRGPIANMPKELFEDLGNLFNHGSRADISDYFLGLLRTPSASN